MDVQSRRPQVSERLQSRAQSADEGQSSPCCGVSKLTDLKKWRSLLRVRASSETDVRAAFLGSGVLFCEPAIGAALCSSPLLSFWQRICRKFAGLRALAANLLLGNAHTKQATLHVDAVPQMPAFD